MRLVGYSDRLSVAPGEAISFMVSSAHPTYRADLVRLVHGDTNPLGPGFIEELVPASLSGEYPGRVQEIVTGSYVAVADQPAFALSDGFTVQAWILPTTPEAGRQGIVTKWSAAGPAGFALVIERGMLALWKADASGEAARVSSGAPLRAGTWHFVAASFDAGTGQVRLVQEPQPAWPLDASRCAITTQTAARSLRLSPGPLLIAAMAGDRPGSVAAHYNGKIDRLSLFTRPLTTAELDGLRGGGSPLALGDALAAAWDFSLEISSRRAVDRFAARRAWHGGQPPHARRDGRQLDRR